MNGINDTLIVTKGRKRRRKLEEIDEDVLLRREGMRALREEKLRQVLYRMPLDILI